MEDVKAVKPILKDPKQGRRYESGLFPVYDRFYEQVMAREWPSNPQRVLELIEGPETEPENGKKVARMLYADHEAPSQGKLEALQPKFAELEEKHEFQSYELVRKGVSLAPDTSWDGPLLESLLELQALKDAYCELARQAREQIELEKEKKKQEKQKTILKYGLSGEPILPHKGSEHDFQGHPNAKPIVEIDGQNVSLHPDSHIPYIDDELSPYHEMILIDYRDMAESWRKDNDLDEASIEQLNEKRSEDDKPPTNYQSLYKQKGLDSDSFPDWPEDARKINEI